MGNREKSIVRDILVMRPKPSTGPLLIIEANLVLVRLDFSNIYTRYIGPWDPNQVFRWDYQRPDPINDIRVRASILTCIVCIREKWSYTL